MPNNQQEKKITNFNFLSNFLNTTKQRKKVSVKLKQGKKEEEGKRIFFREFLFNFVYKEIQGHYLDFTCHALLPCFP